MALILLLILIAELAPKQSTGIVGDTLQPVPGLWLQWIVRRGQGIRGQRFGTVLLSVGVSLSCGRLILRLFRWLIFGRAGRRVCLKLLLAILIYWGRLGFLGPVRWQILVPLHPLLGRVFLGRLSRFPRSRFLARLIVGQSRFLVWLRVLAGGVFLFLE